MDMKQQLGSKAVEILKKLGLSPELLSSVDKELSSGSENGKEDENKTEVSVEISKEKETESEDGGEECVCPKCGNKFVPESPKESAPAEGKMDMQKKMMESKV